MYGVTVIILTRICGRCSANKKEEQDGGGKHVPPETRVPVECQWTSVDGRMRTRARSKGLWMRKYSCCAIAPLDLVVVTPTAAL